MINGAKKRVRRYLRKKDGTYDSKTGLTVEYMYGFQVSFVRPEAFNLSDDDWDIITAHIMEQTGSIEHIGVYGGVAETSFWCKDKTQAVELMQMFNQDSILDWGKKSLYPNNINEWFIENRNQTDREVDYDTICKKIRKNNNRLS